MTTPPDATPPSSPPKGDRIAKLLARAGIASRREIERMIEDGRVALDGVVLETPATILTSLRGVTVDGTPVEAPTGARLFLYHKPPGLLVTERDPAGRRTIYDELPTDLPRLVPVGRLDLNTEGLLLLTTDGGLKRQLELPATGVERAYRARAYGMVTQTQLEDLIEGVEIEGIRYGSIDANIERRTGANVWIEMILTEGKNREVRRVLEHLELQVSRLIRTRYGPFLLGDLKPGEIGEVKQHDLVAFRKMLDGPKLPQDAGAQPTVEVEAQNGARARRAVAPRPATTPAPRPMPVRSASEPDRPMRQRAPVAPRPTPVLPDHDGERPMRQRPAAAPAAKPAKSGWGQSQQRRIQARNAAPVEAPAHTRADARPPRQDGVRPGFREASRASREGEELFTRPPRPNDRANPRPAGANDQSRQRPNRADRDSDAPRRTPRSATGRPGAPPPRSGPAKPGPGKGPAGGRGHPPRKPGGKPGGKPRTGGKN